MHILCTYIYIFTVGLNVTFFLPFFSLLPSFFHFSTNRRSFHSDPCCVFRQFFRRVHRPDSTAETRVNIKKPFDSADNKHHARILIFNIAPEFQMRHPLSTSVSHLSTFFALHPRIFYTYIYIYIHDYSRLKFPSTLPLPPSRGGGNNNA